MRRTAPGLALFLLLTAGCGGPRGNAPPAGTSGIEIRAAEDHPRLGLVARQGDPFAAVAVAVAHDFGGTASLWLGTLIAQRLERATRHLNLIPLRPTGNGFVLGSAVETAEEAARYVHAMNDALATPFAADDLSQAEAVRQGGPPLQKWASAAEAAVASCDGELGDRAVPRIPTLAEVEHWRTAARSAGSVAFASVGPRAVLEATASALHATPPWPSRHALTDPWPAADVIGDGPTLSSGQSLSIALRLADGEKALGAAALLGGRRSALAAHLAALGRPWTLDRVVGTLRPRGACLRVDLSSNEPDSPSPSPRRAAEAAEVAALVLDEADRSLAETRSGRGGLDAAVLGQSDPRGAAAIAAWHALSSQLPPGPTRTLVSYGSSTGRETDPNGGFPRLLSETRAARKGSSLEVRSATEPGQGEVWMLLASPCATDRESGENAGVSALSMRALATALPEIDGARLEPWVSSDGIGLLAHGPRLDRSETGSHHAERIANALGQAFAVTPLSDAATAAARARLSGELSPEMDPLWPIALEALSPKHTRASSIRGAPGSRSTRPRRIPSRRRVARSSADRSGSPYFRPTSRPMRSSSSSAGFVPSARSARPAPLLRPFPLAPASTRFRQRRPAPHRARSLPSRFRRRPRAASLPRRKRQCIS